MTVPIIDLFAGPGGLAEGFSTDIDDEGNPTFKVKLSIEKDALAHQTLELRAFFRQFRKHSVPDDYYSYVSRALSRENLFKEHPDAALQAAAEAWLVELGESPAVAHEVDTRIKKALNGRRDWLLIGGPPCQAYSLVGRSRIRGESEQKYKDDHRHFLYREYLKILAAHRPAAFVMENVKGLLSTRLDDNLLVLQLIKDLENPRKALGASTVGFGDERTSSYKLYALSNAVANKDELTAKDFVVCAEQYGIPQTRHRIVIVGVRDDIQRRPGTLRSSPENTISDAISDLPRVRSGLSREEDSAAAWSSVIADVANAPWLRDSKICQTLKAELLKYAAKPRSNLTRGAEFVSHEVLPAIYSTWFHDARLNGVLNHQTRVHMRSDLHRYLFASVFARLNSRTPKLRDFPEKLLPKHENVDEALSGSKFNDRFRVQTKSQPATTIVSHICKDGHYFVHYDPIQCRSLTVREAARLQTFPDNYLFEGPRTEQYRQVGNAVPPLLARKIAKAVRPVFG